MKRQSLYHDETYDSILARIDKLSPDTPRQWGTMTCSQMLAHCAEVQEVCNGSRSLDRTPALFKLLGPVVKKVVLLNRPFPRNSKTHPQYIITDSTDFEIEKRRLLASLHHFDSMTDDEHASVVHPVFGKMTRDEKGWLFYKHLDHHLTQFGV